MHGGRVVRGRSSAVSAASSQPVQIAGASCRRPDRRSRGTSIAHAFVSGGAQFDLRACRAAGSLGVGPNELLERLEHARGHDGNVISRFGEGSPR